jgi:2-oxoglutarate ferredoxin oxidoreductase subunit beta
MTTPDGNPEKPFDVSQLVVAAGASYVARYSVYHVRQLIKALKDAFQHRDSLLSRRSLPVRCNTAAQRFAHGDRDARLFQRAVRAYRSRPHHDPGQLQDKILIGEFVA